MDPAAIDFSQIDFSKIDMNRFLRTADGVDKGEIDSWIEKVNDVTSKVDDIISGKISVDALDVEERKTKNLERAAEMRKEEERGKVCVWKREH